MGFFSKIFSKSARAAWVWAGVDPEQLDQVLARVAQAPLEDQDLDQIGAQLVDLGRGVEEAFQQGDRRAGLARRLGQHVPDDLDRVVPAFAMGVGA